MEDSSNVPGCADSNHAEDMMGGNTALGVLVARFGMIINAGHFADWGRWGGGVDTSSDVPGCGAAARIAEVRMGGKVAGRRGDALNGIRMNGGHASDGGGTSGDEKLWSNAPGCEPDAGLTECSTGGKVTGQCHGASRGGGIETTGDDAGCEAGDKSVDGGWSRVGCGGGWGGRVGWESLMESVARPEQTAG